MAEKNEIETQPVVSQPPRRSESRQPEQPKLPESRQPAGQVEKNHPASKAIQQFRDASAAVKSKATGENEHKRVADLLRKIADACESAAGYTSERGSGFDDKPVGKAAASAYDDNAIKVMRFDAQSLLDQVRSDTQTQAAMIAAARGSRPAAISPEIELLLRQLLSALLSRFFGGMRFEGEAEDSFEARRIVTRPEPRRAATKGSRTLGR